MKRLRSPARFQAVPVSLALLALWMLVVLSGCSTSQPLKVVQSGVVEAACGQCLFHLPGKGCNLAIRHGGRAHFVDGVDLDSLGGAHAADGLCQVIRRARVSGEFKNGRFFASEFKLLPIEDAR